MLNISFKWNKNAMAKFMSAIIKNIHEVHNVRETVVLGRKSFWGTSMQDLPLGILDKTELPQKWAWELQEWNTVDINQQQLCLSPLLVSIDQILNLALAVNQDLFNCGNFERRNNLAGNGVEGYIVKIWLFLLYDISIVFVVLLNHRDLRNNYAVIVSR